MSLPDQRTDFLADVLKTKAGVLKDITDITEHQVETPRTVHGKPIMTLEQIYREITSVIDQHSLRYLIDQAIAITHYETAAYFANVAAGSRKLKDNLLLVSSSGQAFQRDCVNNTVSALGYSEASIRHMINPALISEDTNEKALPWV